MSDKTFMGCLACLAVCALLVVGIVVPGHFGARKVQRRVEAVNNLKMLTLAAQVYAHDADGRLPAAQDWCDTLIRPLGTNADPPLTREWLAWILGRKQCGYAINLECAGQPMASLNPEDVVFLPVNVRGANLSADLNNPDVLWWDGRDEMELVTLGGGTRQIQRRPRAAPPRGLD